MSRFQPCLDSVLMMNFFTKLTDHSELMRASLFCMDIKRLSDENKLSIENVKSTSGYLSLNSVIEVGDEAIKKIIERVGEILLIE